jgi:hypothetical protein
MNNESFTRYLLQRAVLELQMYSLFSPNFSQTKLAVVSAILPNPPDSEWDFHFDDIGFNSCIQMLDNALPVHLFLSLMK